MKLTVIALRNVMRNRRRSLLSGVAITIAVMTIIFMVAMINGLMSDYKYNVQDFITGHIRIRNILYDKEEENNPLQLNIKDTEQLMHTLDSIPEVKGAAPRIQFGTLVYGSPLLYQQDITDYPGFLSYLQNEEHPLSRELMKKASPALKAQLAQYAGKEEIPADFKILLLDYLNIPLQKRLNPEKIGAEASKLSPATREWEAKIRALDNGTWAGDYALPAYLPYYNRRLMEDLLPQYIQPTARTSSTVPGVGLGVDFNREKQFIGFEKFPLQGSLPADGKYAKEVLLTSGLASELQLSIGDTMAIYTKTSDRMSMNENEFRVTGIVTLNVGMFNKKFFFIPIDTARDFLKMENAATDILVYAKNSSQINQLSGKINSILTAGYNTLLAGAPDKTAKAAAALEKTEARPWTTIGMFSSFINLANYAYLFMSLFFFGLASTVIVVTTMMVIFERMREIGTIAAMGMRGGEIVRLFFLEAFYIAVAAAGAGVIIGLAVTIPLGIIGLDFTSLMQGIEFQIAFKIYPSIDFITTMFIFLYAVGIASLASVIPSRRAAGIEPVEALRSI